jgi:tetratricopeptide (TPR) repeat protein
VLLFQSCGQSGRLAPERRRVQLPAATDTTRSTLGGRNVAVECKEKLVKSGVRQQCSVQWRHPSECEVMAKQGRNERCHCGSGKKYKHCCLTNDEAAERERIAATPLRPTIPEEIAATLMDGYVAHDEKDELTITSNAAVDLVNTGKLDEAERAARDLLERFPEVHDGWDRLGMVYEARGDNRQAADCYRKVVEFVRAHPEQYDPGYDAMYQKMADELDPRV